MANNESLRLRLRYAFDKSMSRGTIALIGWLGLISLIVMIVSAMVISVGRITQEGEEPQGFLESFWRSMLRTLDPGTMGGDSGWVYRLVMLAVTVAGIFIVSTLIGVLSSGIEDKVSTLRKGRSRALESDHTVILNWSPAIFDVISEVATANESRQRPRIVVLAAADKVEMEDEIAAKVAKLGKTRVICRSGDPTDLYDLSLTNPQTARSIVVLSPEGVDDPDSRVIKSVLSLVNDPDRRSEKYSIVAEIRDADNVPIARAVGRDELHLVVADDLLARVFVNSNRQPGLSLVYTELLDFEGCEIYVTEQSSLVGKSFDAAVMAYDQCTPIGICDRGGVIRLNPPGETLIAKGDRMVIIAEDDSAIRLGTHPAAIDESALREPTPGHKRPDRTLVIGWNRRGPRVVSELSRFVEPGSVLTIAADTPDIEEAVEALELPTENLRVELRRTSVVNRRALDALDVPSYDHVMVLGYSDTLEAQAADTQTLVVLLQLREIAEAAGRHVSVVSEMVDIRNHQLAQATRADDFVVSNKLVSLMLAQASENEFIESIFLDLLNEEGSEFYLRPVTDYVDIEQPVNFYTVAEAARRRAEVAVGYYCLPNGSGVPEVVVNPVKSQARQFKPTDEIVVLAEN